MREHSKQNQKSPRSPVSVRFNDEEWERLNVLRGNLPVATYIKGVVFSTDLKAFRKSGSLYFDDFTMKQIARMATDIRELRNLLMESLGKKRLSGPRLICKLNSTPCARRHT